MMDPQDTKPWCASVLDTVAENPWFRVLLQSVVLPDGSDRTYYTLDFPNPTVGVVVRRGQEFLLLHQYRFIIDEYVWAIPSGGVNVGESLEEAAARELTEETGYQAGSIRHLLTFYPSYGSSNQRFEIFLAEDISSAPDAYDANEVLSTKWFSRQELLALVMQNGVVDGLSLAPLLLVLIQDLVGSSHIGSYHNGRPFR